MKALKKRTFKLWHSFAGTAALLLIEVFVIALFTTPVSVAILCAVAIIGSVITLYVATEVIEEVRKALSMLGLLSVVTLQFIVFFAFQYGFLLALEPASFPTLPSDWTGLMLQSTMTFVFNPLYAAATVDARILMLINTLGGLGLAFFILQNISQIKRKAEPKPKL